MAPLSCDKVVLPGVNFSYGSIFTSYMQNIAVMHVALPKQLFKK